jgi:hypothetical protein
MSAAYDTVPVGGDAPDARDVPTRGPADPASFPPADPAGTTDRPSGRFRLNTPDLRPDLAGMMLHLPPGRWWSPDGWLHVEVEQVGRPDHDRDLPDGWVWVVGTLHLDGEGIDTCTVPVRLDALPPAPAAPASSQP